MIKHTRPINQTIVTVWGTLGGGGGVGGDAGGGGSCAISHHTTRQVTVQPFFFFFKAHISFTKFPNGSAMHHCQSPHPLEPPACLKTCGKVAKGT